METTKVTHTVIRVTLAERGLEARARVLPPVPVAPEEIRIALAKHGVTEGVDETALLTLAEFPRDEEVLIARGQAPVHGEAARIEYFFLAEPPEFAPLIDQEDRADYREVTLIQNVVPGQLLARKIPATLGFSGRSVTGEVIEAKPGKDVHLLAGKNVELSANKLEAFAVVHGIPQLVRNRLSVLPVFHVNDVDFSVGNINFQGSVVIRGTVHPGFSVKATEDINVEGNVEQGILEAGGSIHVRGGVRNHAKLTAAHEIRVRFCDSNSELTAGQSLHVLGDSMHCTLSSRHRLFVDHHLIGGVARAGELVQAGIVGTQAGAATRIEFVQDGAKEELEHLETEIADLETDLSEITALIQRLMREPQAIEDGPSNLQRLTPMKVNMSIRLLQLKNQLQEIQETQDALEPPKLVVKGELYPGAVLRFSTREGTRTQRVLTKQFVATYSFVDGVIQS